MGFGTGILGINARNLLYLRPFNKKKAVQLADNKLKTKQFLGTRGIPVARLYATLHSSRELERFDWTKLPKNFVIKPNRGYGGEGFKLVRNFLATDTALVNSLKHHILDIFDGHYSLSNAPDIALLEQEIVPSKIFHPLTTYGLPDIRVIVFNLVPVMAMLRLPTKESGGTANLHQGGAIVGLDMATGEAMHMFYRGKYVDRLPDSSRSIHGFTLPHWDEILLIAVKTQVLSNVGYLAVDIVLDQKDQPFVLELNARGGLGIQLANMSPLRRRLERVRGLKVTVPEKGVRMGKDLFGRFGIEREVEALTGKNILGGIEHVELLSPEKGKPFKLLARIDSGKLNTSLDRHVAETVGLVAIDSPRSKEFIKAEFLLGKKRIKTAVSLKDYSKAHYQMIIGQRDLKDFLIDPTRDVSDEAPEQKKAVPLMHSIIRDAGHIDAQLVLIDRQLKLLKALNPVNSREETRKFFESDGSYNPIFTYPTPRFSKDAIFRTLDQCKPDQTPIGQLLDKKIIELRNTTELVLSVGKPRFTELSEVIFGSPSTTLVEEAIAELSGLPAAPPELHDLPADMLKLAFERTLDSYGLARWNIQMKEDMASDCAVGKLHTIFIKFGARFSEDRIRSLVRHEIETHILTSENGRLQPYKIFGQGCAGYLMTQEGLAVHNQHTYSDTPGVIPKRTEKFYWPAATTYAISIASKASFAQIVSALRDSGFSKERAYQIALKAKRGISNTAEPGACTRNFVYFAGRKMIEAFIAQGGDVRDLYIGKIALQDIDLVKRIGTLRSPKYLPTFLTHASI